MTVRSQRAILVMAMMLTALCADQLMAVEGALRPQAVMQVLEGVAGRMIREHQQQQPTPVRFAQPMRKWSGQPRIAKYATLWHAHPSGLNRKDLWLPPPVA